MPQLAQNSRTPPPNHYYSHHSCCAAAAQNQMVMNAYGTALRHQHYRFVKFKRSTRFKHLVDHICLPIQH